MANPKRVSLPKRTPVAPQVSPTTVREREAAAIAETVNRDLARPSQPVPVRAPVQPPEEKVSSGASPVGKSRLGTSWQAVTFEEAKSAYMVDLDLSDTTPNAFNEWIEAAIVRHARLSPNRRQKVVATLPPETRDEPPRPRSFDVATSALSAMDEAITEDRQRLAVLNGRSSFVRDAVRAAVADVKQRSGRTELPPAPARLPRRPPK